MTWTEGRKLKEISKSGLDVSFEYGFDGIRRKKTANGVVTEFITDGITILTQKTEDRVLTFLTDGNGDTYGFTFNGAPHFYIKNVPGNVVGITNTEGNIEARYTYDSWGKLISITDENGVDRTTDGEFIGYINPLRYRGYYYDSETSLYYLNARYYDPETCRFLNADDNFSNLDLFVYCNNNPMMHSDSTGRFIDVATGMIASAVFAALSYYIEYKLGMRSLDWLEFATNISVAASLGAVGGYISGWAKFAALAKHARLPKIFAKFTEPLVRRLVVWSSKGLSFIIKSFVKSLSRRPGENWGTAARRWLSV